LEWCIDTAHKTRGIWFHTAFAWYKFKSPSNTPALQPGGAVISQEGKHQETRAKFNLVSNLADIFDAMDRKK